MQHVILFGGGDGGGWIITEGGIKRIPPFDPPLVASLKFVTAVNRLKSVHSEVASEMSYVSARLAGEAFEHISEQVGGLNKNTGLVVFDDGDGWWCGTPPHPRPLPHGPFPWVGPIPKPNWEGRGMSAE